MKKIIIAACLLFAGCNVRYPLVVTGVIKNDGRYEVYLNEDYYFFTDSAYHVGDTLK